MIEPRDPDHARKLTRLSGPSCEAAFAFLDGYEGVDRSARLPKNERAFYDEWWLKGAEYREQHP
jgi:hypothetical protein